MSAEVDFAVSAAPWEIGQGVVLPSIDGATSYRDQIDNGDVVKIADGLTLVPAPGWDLAAGALIGRTRSPLGTTATTEVVDGSVALRVQTAPFDGTPSAQLTRFNEIDADLDSVQSSPAATTRCYAARTRQGAVGVAEDFVGVDKQGTIVAFVFRPSTSSQGEPPREGVEVFAPAPMAPLRAGATTSSR